MFTHRPEQQQQHRNSHVKYRCPGYIHALYEMFLSVSCSMPCYACFCRAFQLSERRIVPGAAAKSRSIYHAWRRIYKARHQHVKNELLVRVKSPTGAIIVFAVLVSMQFAPRQLSFYPLPATTALYSICILFYVINILRACKSIYPSVYLMWDRCRLNWE